MYRIIILAITYLYNKLVRKKPEIVDEADLYVYKPKFTFEQLMGRIDFTEIPEPIIESTDKLKTLLILDDIQASRLMYQTDFSKINRKTKLNVKDDFNIVFATGNRAGYIAYNYITNLKCPVDIALLDITLGGIIRFDDGEYVELDGVDIAIELRKRNENIKFVFSTSHGLNRGATDMKYYFDKFEAATGECMSRYYLDKNNNDKDNDRAAQLKRLLYG